MERIALDAAAFDGFVEESEIEVGVVAHEDRTTAVRRTQLLTDNPENPLQGVAFGDGRPQRMVGIDPVHLERLRFDIRAIERKDMKPVRLCP